MNDPWIIEDMGHTVLWTLSRPRARNALSRNARHFLEMHIKEASGLSEKNAIIITGEGEKAFSAGADLEERSGMNDKEIISWLDDLQRTFHAIESSPKIFIAAINGAALGGGLELALACDIRTASFNAVMGLPEVRLGIIPGGGGTQRLSRLIGYGKAKDLILSGRIAGAKEALSIGLVEHISPEEEGAGGALKTALELAEKIGECAPKALQAAKKAICTGFELPLKEALEIEKNCYIPLLETNDRREGLNAFREKRKPVYRGN